LRRGGWLSRDCSAITATGCRDDREQGSGGDVKRRGRYAPREGLRLPRQVLDADGAIQLWASVQFECLFMFSPEGDDGAS
jgi:hypothetical protein